jgi:anti-sigma regulatory factor (Ser/Thr protein kinase)
MQQQGARIAPEGRRTTGNGAQCVVCDLQLTLGRDSQAPRSARRAILRWSENMPLDAIRRELLELLVSETVTNAVRHSEAHEQAPIGLTASFHEDEVLVTVTDRGSGRLPRMRTPSGAQGGYGLRIVDRESRRWGVERAADTSVWFAI